MVATLLVASVASMGISTPAGASEPQAGGGVGSIELAVANLVGQSTSSLAPAEAAAAMSGASSISSEIADLAAKCQMVTAVTITFANDPATYVYDEASGELEEGKEVQASGCATASSGGLATVASVDKGNNAIISLTPASPGYWAPGSPIDISGQITFGGSNPGAFGAMPTPDLSATAVGPATHNAIRTGGVNCSYNKVGILPSYAYHYSCPSHSLGIVYKWVGVVVWPNKFGGTTTINYWYSYRLSTPSGGPV